MPSCASLLSAFLLATPLLSIILGAQAPPRDRPPAQEEGTGAIRGQVVVADEGTPVSRVQVVAVRMDQSKGGPPFRYQALSHDTGQFRISGLPAGRYSVFLIVPHDRPQFVAAPSGRPVSIVVGDGDAAEKVVLTLQRACVIAGRVVNEFGEPMASARVSALMIQPGGSEPSETGFGRETDDLGRFRLFGLGPGQYYVKVDPQAGRFSFGEDDPVRYVTAYYPGVGGVQEAQPLSVSPGQELDNIEIPIRRGRTFRVSGVVLNAQGGPSPRASVVYQSGGQGSGFPTQPDGTFTISGLAAGEYTIHASTMMGPSNDAEPEASEPVTLQVDSDVDGLTLATRRAARVAGRIVVERRGALSLDTGPAQILIHAASPERTMSFGPPPTADVRPDGTFALTRLSGPVLLRAETRGPWHLKAVRYRGTDITDEPTEFSDSPDPKHLEVVITDRGARLTAHVRDDRGSPAGDGYVVLFSADEKRRGATSMMTRVSGLGRGGAATLEGLLPGTYLAVALEPGAGIPVGGRGRDEMRFEKLVPLATRVELLENDSREISLTLVATPQ